MSPGTILDRLVGFEIVERHIKSNKVTKKYVFVMTPNIVVVDEYYYEDLINTEIVIRDDWNDDVEFEKILHFEVETVILKITNLRTFLFKNSKNEKEHRLECDIHGENFNNFIYFNHHGYGNRNVEYEHKFKNIKLVR